MFDWDRIDAQDFEYTGKNIAAMAKLCLFLTIMIGMGSFIGAAVLISNRYDSGKKLTYGICNLIGCILIIIRYSILFFICIACNFFISHDFYLINI